MVYKKKTINKVTTVTRDKNGQNETIYLSAFTWHTRKLACKMQPTFNIMTDLSTSKKKKARHMYYRFRVSLQAKKKNQTHARIA